MSHADYQTALKNGIDAARSGSRMMARLHLLKAADYAAEEVASHIWLAWVAETPADALVHLEEALTRNPQHGLAQVGKLWTKLMAEFDATKDYAHCDVSGLSSASPSVVTAARAATAAAAASAGPGTAAAVPFANQSPVKPESPFDSEPLDLTRTVRMDLIRRPRADEESEPSGLTCFFPKEGSQTGQPGAFENRPSLGTKPTSVNEELPPGATIRLDVNAVRRALAESVIAELTSVESGPDGGGASTNVTDLSPEDAASLVNAASAVANAANLVQPVEGVAIVPSNGDESERPRIDEYTEPPVPAIAPDLIDDQSAPPEPRVLTGPRVLVVDDSPTVRKLVASTLESRGYRVACASSGYEAIEILSQATPDALVTEIDLPRLDGLHLCKLLRSQDATRHTPVIFLTRRSGTMDRMRGKMVGATGYLTKPFRSVALIDELATCCPSG